MKIKNIISILSILLVCGIYSNTAAQNGKLVGQVLDKQTGEPLIGANVMVEGYNIGAATDVDGDFLILNVPPGTYNIVASMIGFTRTIQENVHILIDRTTQIDFELSDSSIEMDQVIVVADKPAVIKDRTSSASHIEAEQIVAAPISGLRGAMDLSAGFQKDATGNYSVRGSGSHEVSFRIDGVVQSTSNTSAPGSFDTEKSDNSWKYDVNPLGVQQVQMITGGFSAEYGNAQAGVVNVVLKEGQPKFHGEFRVEYRPPGQYHYGDYIYDKSNYEWEKWGDLSDWMNRRDDIIKELKLDIRWEEIKNSDPERYNELIDKEIKWAHGVWVKNHEPSEDNVLGVYDYRDNSYQRYLFGFGGPLGKNSNLLKFHISGEYKRNPTRLPTPEKVQELQNYILNLTYQPIKNHKLKIMANYQSYVGGIWSGSDDIRWSGLAFSPPGVSTKYLITIDPVREEQTIGQSLNWVYTIDNTSFLDLTLTHQQERYELPYKYLAGYGLEVDRLDSLTDQSGTVLREGSWWEKDYFRAPFSFSTNYYQDSRTENFGIKVDYTNQITSTNLLKAGFKVDYWDMLNNGVNSSFQSNSYVARNGFADYYRAFPISFSMYLQDKLEYEGLIANLGLRTEIYNFQTGAPIDRFNVLYPGTDGPGNTGNPATANSEWKYILLPRIGISFPIGASTAFRFQYGHFASMPIFTQALSKKTWVGWQGIGNPNLDPKLTINYEFGIQQQLGDHRLDAVLFYNDRTTQIGRQNVASYTGSRNQFAGFASDNNPLYYYWSFENNAFGSTVGFELTLETYSVQNWSYRISYSLSETTLGNYGASMIYPDETRGYSTRDYTGEFIASWDRTHNFRGMVQYFIRENEGPSIWGSKFFDNMVFSLTYTAQSGTPFTYITDFSLKDIRNNRRYPLETNVNINITKDVWFGDVKIIFGLRVMNVFDNKWITPMTTSQDIALWAEEGITVADAGNDPNRLSYIVAPYRAYRNLPRQIFFTLGIGF